MKPLISDAAAPMRRALHVDTLVIADDEKVFFDLEVPGPAILRKVYARVKSVETKVRAAHGGAAAKGDAILLVLVFEVDPAAAPVTKSYYALLLGSVIEGAAVADLLFCDVATLPNGAPIALYERTPTAKPARAADPLASFFSQGKPA